MLLAIYATVAMQAFVFSIVCMLVAFRLAVYANNKLRSKTRKRLGQLVLGLLDGPEQISRLTAIKGKYDRKVLRDLLLRQASELAGQDREESTRFFQILGLDTREIQGLRSRNWSRRVEAAANLGVMLSPAAVDAFVESLRDDQEAVRLASLGSLGEIGGIEDIDIFLDMVREDGRWSRVRLIDAILQCRPPLTPKTLNRMIDDPSANIRSVLAQVSGLLRINEAAAFLIRALKDPDHRVRSAAAASLERLGDPLAYGSLIQASEDQNPGVRKQCASALGALGDPGASGALGRLMGDEDLAVRRAASKAMAQLGSSGIEILERAAGASPSVAQRAAAQVLAERSLSL